VILAIDPGPVKSSAVLWNGNQILGIWTDKNELLLHDLFTVAPVITVIEQIKSYGMAVGETVFQTVFWAGRFAEAAFRCEGFEMMPRMDVKMHICGSSRAKDGNIIQALRDRFGEKPSKTKPNPVYNGFKPAADEWQAWALSVTWWDKNHKPKH